jgi:hypothetical protein
MKQQDDALQRKKMIAIAEDIADGNRIDTQCPYCSTSNLIFSFTVIPKIDMFGLFLVCTNCRKGEHFTFSQKPKGFRPELILDEYQLLEDEANKG